MANEKESTEYCKPDIGKDVHDEMRKGSVDIGGEETTTKKLMRPQTQGPEAFDAD